MSDRYWFWDWLDESDVKTLDDVEAALESKAVLDDLTERADSALQEESAKPPHDSIVAGTGMDLTGDFSCGHSECRIRQADDLLRRASLYFDQIVVADPLSPFLAHASREGSRPAEHLVSREEKVKFAIEVLLHLREIGAEYLIRFQTRRHRAFCTTHAEQFLASAGMPGIIEQAEEYIPVFANGIEIREGKSSDGTPIMKVKHDVLGDTALVLHLHEDVENLARFASEQVIHLAVESLIADVSIAGELKTALATGLPLQRKLMSDRVTPNTGRVAFELDLPVLQGVPVKDLLRIREAEAESFERFRDALRRAMKERIALDPSSDIEELAREIEQDLLEPELRRITQRLEKANSAFQKKTGTALGVGALVTTCGLLSGLLPIAVVGIGTLAAGTVIPKQQQIDKVSDVELSDMFFLWQLTEGGH